MPDFTRNWRINNQRQVDLLVNDIGAGNKIERDANYPLVSIIILSYNGLEFLRNCLNSLFYYTSYPNLEVLIVDNDSDREVKNYLRKVKNKNNEVKLIFNVENMGYGPGNNVGLKAAKGDYLVLANNDVVFGDKWLTRLVRHFEHKKTGLVGPVTNSCGNNQKIGAPNFDNISEVDRFAQELYEANKGKSRIKKDSLGFYCVAIKREVYNRLGGLDEKYGIGMFEDDDYCLSARQAGYDLCVAEDVFVYHAGMASFSKIKTEEYKAMWDKNKRYFERKWGTKWTPAS